MEGLHWMNILIARQLTIFSIVMLLGPYLKVLHCYLILNQLILL